MLGRAWRLMSWQCSPWRGTARSFSGYHKITGFGGACHGMSRPGESRQVEAGQGVFPKGVPMKNVKVASLVLDFTLYPRNNVDSGNVANIVQALEAGTELPPVIIDKKSRRVIDGFHRVRAAIRHGGEDAEISVIEKTYANDAAMFLDAMKYNAAHGAKLDPCDRVHCCIIAESLSIPLEAVAGALNMPQERLSSLQADRTARSGGLSIALKRTVRGFAGRRLSKRQVSANAKLSGMNQQFYANQLIELIESDMLDKENESLIERLRVLHGLLDGVLAAA
jgi:hypothetical protein